MKSLLAATPGRSLWLAGLLLLFGATRLQAQNTVVLSRNADFSTDDRTFERTDVLYMKVVAPQIDFTDLDKNEFRLKPDEGGNDLHGAFNNHFDGTYTASINLEITDPNVSAWEWRARLEDDAGHELEARLNLRIGDAGDGDQDDDGEDDDQDDDEDENGDEVEVRGRIDALQDAGLSVDSVFFLVTPETHVFDDDDPISFRDLALGMFVEVRGERDADGVLRATRIKIEDEDEDEVELRGTVDAVGSDHVVVSGITFFVGDGTIILDRLNQFITLAGLAEGMLVEVRADLQPDGSLLATRIKVEDRIEDEVEVRGRIEEIRDDAVVVHGRVFRVLPRTRVLDQRNRPITPADLRAGDFVEIRAALLPGDDLVALVVKLEDDAASDLRVAGPFETLEARAFVVLGVPFAFDAGTRFFDDDGNAVSPDRFVSGKTVAVTAVQQPDGTRLAVRVEAADVVVATGAVGDVGPETFTLPGASITVNERTLFLDEADRILDHPTLSAGQWVRVRSLSDAAGLSATRIEILGQTSTATSVEEEGPAVPHTVVLHQNYPNPFNPTTTITFELSGTRATVSLVVYDLLGREVATLVRDVLPAGLYHYAWDARDRQGAPVASGLYLYRLRVGDQVRTRQMVLIK